MEHIEKAKVIQTIKDFSKKLIDAGIKAFDVVDHTANLIKQIENLSTEDKNNV